MLRQRVRKVIATYFCLTPLRRQLSFLSGVLRSSLPDISPASHPVERAQSLFSCQRVRMLQGFSFWTPERCGIRDTTQPPWIGRAALFYSHFVLFCFCFIDNQSGDGVQGEAAFLSSSPETAGTYIGHKEQYDTSGCFCTRLISLLLLRHLQAG